MWLEIAAVLFVGFLIFKFVVKPVFKIVAVVALAFLAWWLFNGL
jgi:hypothetical protein